MLRLMLILILISMCNIHCLACMDPGDIQIVYICICIICTRNIPRVAISLFVIEVLDSICNSFDVCSKKVYST